MKDWNILLVICRYVIKEQIDLITLNEKKKAKRSQRVKSKSVSVYALLCNTGDITWIFGYIYSSIFAILNVWLLSPLVFWFLLVHFFSSFVLLRYGV